jgi:peptide/nickel transport system ATP-binding protein
MAAEEVPQGSPPPTRRDRQAGSPLLEVDNLTVKFPTEDGVVNAVRDVSYTLSEREVLGIVGESGSGKSVSSLAVMGLLPRSAQIGGRIRLNGKDVLEMSATEQRSLRGRRIAMIFQDPMTALNPVYSIGDQLAEAMRSHEAVSKKMALDRAADMLDLVGIPQPRERLGAYPFEFSGGMRQRVMIAMAVINNPDIIIADEPTTALDVTVQSQILEKLVEV